MSILVNGQVGQYNINANNDSNIKIKEAGNIEAKSDTDFTKNELDKSIKKLNNFLKDEKTHAEYSVHDKFTNTIMVKIINDDTKEVIMEIPSKKILDMVAKMCELVGIGIDKKA